MTKLRKAAAVALLAAVCTLSAPVWADVFLELTPAAQTAGLNESITLDLRLSGLDDFFAPALKSYSLNVVFDPGYLAFDGLSFGDPLSPITLP